MLLILGEGQLKVMGRSPHGRPQAATGGGQSGLFTASVGGAPGGGRPGCSGGLSSQYWSDCDRVFGPLRTGTRSPPSVLPSEGGFVSGDAGRWQAALKHTGDS